MTTASVNGVTLHYEVEGDGPPLLLIAGLGANSSAWATVKPLLVSRFTCITFDNRGTGRSERRWVPTRSTRWPTTPRP